MNFIIVVFRTKIFKWFGAFALFILLLIWFCNWWIISSVQERIFSDINKLPFRNVGLVLGANKSTSRGFTNLFFKHRIEAAVELFKKGKIKHIIVSGDNHIKEYDEATDMMNALIELGVPDSCITLDYAGFRTFDSVIRCREVFGQNSFTIISQEFHNQRAVFIGMKKGMDLVAFNAKDVPAKYSFRTQLREYFAKLKAVLDIYVFATSPKFLGQKVEVKIQ